MINDIPTFSGKAKYNINAISACGLSDGTTTEFQFSGLVGTELILSSGGTSNATVVAGKITLTSGTIYNITLSNGWKIPISEGAGTSIYAYDVLGNVFIGVISTTSILNFWSLSQGEDSPDCRYGFSYNATSGVNKITNNEFLTSDGWAKSAQVTITGGVARIASSDGTYQYLARNPGLTAGMKYRLSYRVLQNLAGSLKFSNGSGSYGALVSTVGDHSVDFVATGSSIYIERSSGVTDVSLDYVNTYLVPYGKVPANPITGLSCMGQMLTSSPSQIETNMFSFSDAHQVRVALGWEYGTDHWAFSDAGVPKVIAGSVIKSHGLGPDLYTGVDGIYLYA